MVVGRRHYNDVKRLQKSSNNVFVQSIEISLQDNDYRII